MFKSLCDLPCVMLCVIVCAGGRGGGSQSPRYVIKEAELQEAAGVLVGGGSG